jgi:membrane fusion protein, multidrug efflux system
MLATLSGCKPTPMASQGPLPVAVSRMAYSTEGNQSQYTGVVRPRYEADVGFRVAGKVIERSVEVGQFVRAGELLSKLDPTDYQLNVEAAAREVESAQARAKQARLEEARLEKLVQTSAASQSELDLQRASSDANRAAAARAERLLEIARNQLDYCNLTSPFDGVITSLSLEVGQVVPTGQRVLQVAKPTPLEAVIDVPENRRQDLQRDGIDVVLWSDRQRHLAAVVREVSPTADPVTRTFQARLTLDAIELKPDSNDVQLGMTAIVKLYDRGSSGAFLVPLTAIVHCDQGTSVWVVNTNTHSATASASRSTTTSDVAEERSAPDSITHVSASPSRLHATTGAGAATGANTAAGAGAATGANTATGASARVEDPLIARDRGHAIELRSVDVLHYGQEFATVRGKLQPGDLVIRAGTQKLDAGSSVTIWSESP